MFFTSYILYWFSSVGHNTFMSIISSLYLYILKWKRYIPTMYLPISSMDGFSGILLMFSCMLGSFSEIYSWMAALGKFILVTQQSERSWRHGIPKQGNFLCAWFILYTWESYYTISQFSIARFFFFFWLPLKNTVWLCLTSFLELLPAVSGKTLFPWESQISNSLHSPK